MDIIKKECGSKSEMYVVMAQHIRDIFQETCDLYAALSNASALLALYLDDVNWAGFYIMKDLRKETGTRYLAEDQNENHGKGRVEDQNQRKVKKEKCENRMLVLGPFQGKPAVAHIEVGSGVRGTAVESRRQQRVDDVRSCCNHIACDLATASEIVTPVFVDGDVWGVIDIDSPLPARFDAEDEEGMKVLAKVLGEMVQRKML